MTTSFAESEESDPDSDEEDRQRLKRLLTITKGPPKKLKPDPKKTCFLFTVGLVTHNRKQILELKKYTRRHKILREKSVSPVPEEPAKEPPVEYDSAHLSELSKRLCFEEDFQAKTEFFHRFGLMYLTPEQKKEKENISKVIENERLRRNGILPPSQRCVDLQGPHLRKRGCSILHNLKQSATKRLNVTQCENNQQNEALMKKNKAISSAQRSSAFLKPPIRTVHLPVPPLIPASQVIPPPLNPVPELNKDVSGSVVAPKDPRVRQLNKEFAQEFHNSVLQTTQMQLEKKYVPSAIPVESLVHTSPPANALSEKSDWFLEENKSPFRWPGIEAIMESYECHVSEQSTEKKFLADCCQKLKALIQESNIQLECLGRTSADLVQEKKHLDLEGKELKKNIENLKLFIQHFR